MRFATNCAKAYGRADAKTRRRFNQAVFAKLAVRDGRIVETSYQTPFDVLFADGEFEYGDLVETVETMGLEPTTPCLQSRCSSQLSYVPVSPLQSRLAKRCGGSGANPTAPATAQRHAHPALAPCQSALVPLTVSGAAW